METINLFLEFVQFLADHTAHHYVSIQSIKCVFNLPYFSHWKIILIYRMSLEERSIFWEVIVSVILSKNVYMNMCPIPNGF